MAEDVVALEACRYPSALQAQDCYFAVVGLSYHFKGFKIVRRDLVDMFSEAMRRPCRRKIRGEEGELGR